MNMSYVEIKNILVESGLVECATNVAISVINSAWGKEYTDEEFEALCNLVGEMYLDTDQFVSLGLMADVVCDCYFNLNWGYLDSLKERLEDSEELENGKMSLEDVKKLTYLTELQWVYERAYLGEY